MKEMDKSDLTTDEIALIDDAIARVEAVLENTNVDSKAYTEAENNFYAVREQILNKDAESEENTAYLDFSVLLTHLFQVLSDFLYKYFGGLGFSEM